MSVSRGLVVVGTLLGGALLTGPAALAQTCDAYSGTCPTPAPTVSPTPDQDEDGTTTGVGEGGGEGTLGGGGGTTVSGTGGAQDSGGATLPFTGGEIVLLSTLGLAAVGGGTVLVLAGRRRRDVSPA